MRIVAYCYCNPLLETPPPLDFWGGEVDQIYDDYGDRQQLKGLHQAAQQGRVNYCLVRHLGELAETTTAITEQLSQLEACGVIMVALEQDYMTPTAPDFPNTRQQWTQLLEQIQQYQQRRQRQQRSARQRQQILPPPGRAPYGYRRAAEHYVIDKATAPVVKAFFERFILSGSLRGSVRFLVQCYGKKIAVATGKRWLTHPVYRGHLLYQNQTVVADTHPPLLTRLEAAQIDRLLRRNAPLAPRSASAPRSLAGLVYCERCQSLWTVATVTRPRQSKTYCYLRPKACAEAPKCSAVNYDQVLHQTIDQICSALPQAVTPQGKSPFRQQADQLQTTITEKYRILEKLPSLEAEGILDSQTHQLRRFQIKTEIAALQQQQDQLPPDDLQRILPNVSAPAFWQALSETERRFYLREFIRWIHLDRHPDTWQLHLEFVFD